MVTHSDEERSELDGGHFLRRRPVSARERADVCSCCLDRTSQNQTNNYNKSTRSVHVDIVYSESRDRLKVEDTS